MTRRIDIYQRLDDANRKAKALWIQMCRDDGIEPDAAVVVFSDHNPYRRRYDAVVTQCQELRRLLCAAQDVGVG